MAVINAQGTLFKIAAAATPTVADAQVCIISFSGFDGEANEIDVTTLCSTAKEYRLGLRDQGNFSVEINFDPDDVGQIAIESAQASGAVRAFELELSNGAKANFDGLVKSFSKTGGVDDVLKASVNIRITGDVVWTAAP